MEVANDAETGHVTGGVTVLTGNDPAHVTGVTGNVADHVTVPDALDVTEFTRRLQTFYCYRILMGWVKKKKQTVDI